MVKPVMSFRVPWELLGGWAVPWTTVVYQSLGNGTSNSLVQADRVLAKTCCSEGRSLTRTVGSLPWRGSLLPAGLGGWGLWVGGKIWEFLKENESLCRCYHFCCIWGNQSSGENFALFLEGINKQDFFKIIPRVQLTYTADFLCK